MTRPQRFLIEASILAILAWIATENQDLGTYVFRSSLFLGIRTMLTHVLKKREILATPRVHENTTVISSSHTSVLTVYAPGTHQVRTRATANLNVGSFDPRVGVRTD
jgi:hypothetical protein